MCRSFSSIISFIWSIQIRYPLTTRQRNKRNGSCGQRPLPHRYRTTTTHRQASHFDSFAQRTGRGSHPTVGAPALTPLFCVPHRLHCSLWIKVVLNPQHRLHWKNANPLVWTTLNYFMSLGRCVCLLAMLHVMCYEFCA
jgi:hypothetical protein